MSSRFDIAHILSRIAEEAGVWGVIAIGLAIVLLVGILIMRARLLALALLFAAMCFSNFKEPIGTAAVAIRWISLICLVPLGVTAINRRQGIVVLLLMIYAFSLIIFSVRSHYPLWSLQRSIALVLLIVGVCGSVQVLLERGVRPERLFKGMVFLGVIWAVVNVLPLRGYMQAPAEERYVGEASAAGYGALVMGVLLPFTLWGVFHKWSHLWRIISAGTAAILAVLLLFVATRGGAFLGAIACIPLLLRLSFKRLAVGALVLVLIAGSIALVMRWTHPVQQEFIYRRYIGFSGREITTGRKRLWSTAWNKCASSPWLGHGSGSAILPRLRAGAFITVFHNAYLTVWYETGIFGFMVFITALFVVIRRGVFVFIRSRDHPDLQLDARLMLGLVLGLAAFSLVENGIAGSTNISIGMYLMTIAVIQHFWLRLQPERIEERTFLPHEYYHQPYLEYPAGGVNRVSH